MLLSGWLVAALLADSEYLGAAGRAGALSCRSLVLHDDALGVLDLFLGSALHTVCLHLTLLSADEIVGHPLVRCQCAWPRHSEQLDRSTGRL